MVDVLPKRAKIKKNVGHNGHTKRGGESVCDQFKPFYLLLINQSISCNMLSITSDKSIMSHKQNITSKETQEYLEFDLYLLYMEDNNLLDYYQHQLIRREPTLK